MFAPDKRRDAGRPMSARLILFGTGLLVASACSDAPADSPSPEAAPAPQGVYGTAPGAFAGAPSVVTLRPSGSEAVALAPLDTPHMDQLGLAFSPMQLLVRVGETVSFTNGETVTHNVKLAFSDNDSIAMDAETDPAGRVDFLFDREGGYEVTCDHHPGMRAFIYVTSAPYATFAANNGSFRIADVPTGSYTLSVWSVDPTRRSERALDVTGPSTEVSLGGA
jgi:plastocyanin